MAKRLYLVAQGSSVLVWWGVLYVVPGARDFFTPMSADPDFLWAFLPADLVIVAFGSLVAARAWTSDRPPAAAWVVAGALWSMTIYLFALWWLGHLSAPGPVLMAVASVGTAWTLSARPGREAF